MCSTMNNIPYLFFNRTSSSVVFLFSFSHRCEAYLYMTRLQVLKTKSFRSGKDLPHVIVQKSEELVLWRKTSQGSVLSLGNGEHSP